MEIVDDLEQMTELQCIIEQKHHRSILGNKGKYVQDISAKWNVQIKFPERRRQGDQKQGDQSPPPVEDVSNDDESPRKADIIMVIGKKDKAEEAKKALLVRVDYFQLLYFVHVPSALKLQYSYFKSVRFGAKV